MDCQKSTTGFTRSGDETVYDNRPVAMIVRTDCVHVKGKTGLTPIFSYDYDIEDPITQRPVCLITCMDNFTTNDIRYPIDTAAPHHRRATGRGKARGSWHAANAPRKRMGTSLLVGE